jgi:hypothetical protein
MQEIEIYKDIWNVLVAFVHSGAMVWLLRMLLVNVLVWLLVWVDHLYYKYNWKERIIRFKDAMTQEE